MVERLKVALADRYRIEREIGSGGMAVVFLAQDLKHDRKVAVKVLRPELSASIGAERFLREIQISAKLNHPHILTLIDSGDAQGLLFYVMPYVDGESLRDKMEREGPLPLDEAFKIAREVADGLGHAHRLDIVHRDIKPENVLLSEGHAVVADFGIAKAVSAANGRITKTGGSVGSPMYMSPEQAAGRGNLDGRSDLYSLACMLYEMLTGEPPFLGQSMQALIAKHAMEPPPDVRVLRTSVPEPVGSAIRKALSKTPADRFKTVAEFAATLSTVAAIGDGSRETQIAFPALRSLFLRPVPRTVLVTAAVGYAALNFVDIIESRDVLPVPSKEIAAVTYLCAVAVSGVIAWFHRGKGPQRVTLREVFWVFMIAVVWWFFVSLIIWAP